MISAMVVYDDGVCMMKAKMKCPQCHAPVSWLDNPYRPFCSERCRMIDLGHWAEGAYRIPGRSQQPLANVDNPDETE
jgi:endogenous inhibitor of DNA gyrase (YacG/DUF329 family)